MDHPQAGVVHCKTGVILTGLQPAGIRILSAIDGAAADLRLTLMVTCGLEGHAKEDPHTRGEALDLRTSGFDPLIVVKLYARLTRVLGPLFTVLYECPSRPADLELERICTLNVHASAPHLHLQVRRFVTFPPLMRA